MRVRNLRMIKMKRMLGLVLNLLLLQLLLIVLRTPLWWCWGHQLDQQCTHCQYLCMRTLPGIQGKRSGRIGRQEPALCGQVKEALRKSRQIHSSSTFSILSATIRLSVTRPLKHLLALRFRQAQLGGCIRVDAEADPVMEKYRR